MDEVQRIRQRIDEIDQGIVQLLKRRYENARLLGQIKKARGLSLRDPTRERAILEKVEKTAKTLDLQPTLIRPIFKQVFNFAVQAQQDRPKRVTRELAGLRTLVVGGTGGMGRFFANLARLHGGIVRIVGRDKNRTEKAAQEMEVKPGSLSDVGTSDIVIVAVPMEKVAKVALHAAKKMKPGSLLTDLSSVKTGIADVIASATPRDVEFVSLHPLFSPEVDDVSGQNIAVVPFKTGPIWRRLSSTLEVAGARLQMTTVRSHDLTMSMVQVLHHFALITMGVALTKWNGTLETNSLRISEKRISSLLANWHTIADIQRLNPYAQSARHELASRVKELERMTLSNERASLKTLTSNVQKWTRKI